MSSQSLCFLLTLAVSLGLVIFGFIQLLQKEKASENDVQVVQRQIRGFAYLALAQVILVAGVALCGSLDLNTVRDMVRSVA